MGQQSVGSSEGSASESLNVVEVVAALVALHRQLTRPPLLHLGAGGGLVVDWVHLAHDGLDTGATWHNNTHKSQERSQLNGRDVATVARQVFSELTSRELILLRKKKSLLLSTGSD